ncbi:hypothetical protein [Nocardia pseudovaccinii]|uniref:hypothetical protein n=1 Tax=Nocardia pseudovaccinii TaxID=189540 RepID=UPI0007A4F419|nr:hypothetical protein [Nocardia pseudovaccinii]
MRPPADHSDPIGYALDIAAGLAVDALVVYDLETVGNTPSRVCELFDLQTVCPPTTWAAVVPDRADNTEHAHPGYPLTITAAQRIMQQHLMCPAHACPRKASAYSFLVQAGKIVPPVDTPRERAAARQLPFKPRDRDIPLPVSVDIETLLDVLNGLTNPQADARVLAAQLNPSSVHQTTDSTTGKQ